MFQTASRLAWFRRKQELHFVYHRHANSNFVVIHPRIWIAEKSLA
jgi:hypothetical protein